MITGVACQAGFGASTARSSDGPVVQATACHKLRPSQTQLLDPDDLRQRLSRLLAEQNAQAPSRKHTTFGAAWRNTHATPGLAEPSIAPTTYRGEQRRRPASKQDAGHIPYVGPPHKHRLHLASSKKPLGSSGKGAEPVVSSSYRHVPQVAASQFARTATAESPVDRRLVHKLSRKVISFHQDGPNTSHDMAASRLHAAPDKKAQTTQRVRSMRERQYGRNQLHYTPTLATMMEADEQRPPCHHRHSLDPCARGKMEPFDDHKNSAKRRRSTGSIFGVSEGLHKGSFSMLVGLAAGDRRGSGDALDLSEHHPVDWTQSDEERARLAVLVVSSPPPLRKTEAKWDLRGRLGSLARHGRDVKTSSPPQERTVSRDSPRSPKGGRH